MALGAQDQRGRQAEPGGDGERPRLARPVVDEPEGGRQRGGVELHRGIARARLDGGEGAQRLEVRGGHDQRPALGERLENRAGQGRAFVRIGAGAQLVEQHEGAGVRLGEHLADLFDEGGEGREVLGDRLVVADHGEDPLEDRYARAFGRGDVAAGLGHEREQGEGLERDGLAARVGPGNQQQRPVGGELEIHRHDLARGVAPALREEQRVACGLEVDAALAIEGRPRGLHAVGEVGAGEHPVQGAERLHERGQLVAPRAHRLGQLGEDARGLLLLVALEGDEVVVRLHHRLGLDEKGLAALRAVVDDAAQPPAGLGPDGQHVATVPDGDEAVSEDAIALGLQQPLEVGDEAAPSLPELAAYGAEPGARAIGQGSVVVERLAQELAEVGQARQAVRARGEPGRDRTDRARVGGQVRRRVEQREQREQLGSVQHAAVGMRAVEDRAGVGQAVEWRSAFLGQRATRLGGGIERFVDLGGGAEGLRRRRALAPYRGARVGSDQGADGVPFDPAPPETACLHPGPHSLPSGLDGSAGGTVRSTAANRPSAPAASPSCARRGPSACAERWASRNVGAS